jgi:hypothetical protein
LRDSFEHLISRTRYLADRSAQLNGLNSIIRSVAQLAAFSAIDVSVQLLDGLEDEQLAILARRLQRPSDRDPEELLNYAIPSLLGLGFPLHPWFGTERLGERYHKWVTFRNNKVGHGVVSAYDVDIAMDWLPALARDLLEGLSSLLPEYRENSWCLNSTLPQALADVKVEVFNDQTAIPVVVREIRVRGDSSIAKLQTVDPDHSREFTAEYLFPRFAALTTGKSSDYQQRLVDLSDGFVWRPTVLLPIRQTSTFLGRENEKQQVLDWLNDSDSKVCNLYGEGGIGKQP